MINRPGSNKGKTIIVKAPLPPNEEERLKTLRHYDILDTLPEQDFDDITLLASQICGAPMVVLQEIVSSL